VSVVIFFTLISALPKLLNQMVPNLAWVNSLAEEIHKKDQSHGEGGEG
jgi:hypothetical protein